MIRSAYLNNGRAFTGQPTNHNDPLLAPRVCFELGPQAKCLRDSIKQHSTKGQRKVIAQIILCIEAGSLFYIVSDPNWYSRETMLFSYSRNGNEMLYPFSSFDSVETVFSNDGAERYHSIPRPSSG